MRALSKLSYLSIYYAILTYSQGQKIINLAVGAQSDSGMDIVGQIANSIIRPARERYHMNRLGPKDFSVRSPDNIALQVRREDSCVINGRKQKVFYSFYRNSGCSNPKLVVVYLHANNGSRVEGLHYLDALLTNGFNVCLLDCSGSGSSDGEYVTLGPN